MEKKRDLNLDLIRAAAVTMVVAVHFFLNCGFYETPLTGFRMVAATAVRTLLMVCVPLFLLLTGYLRAGKAWSPGYYRGLGRILLTYLLCSLICLAFRTVYLREALSAMDYLRGILHFSGAPYGWYVEMFVGLYLLSPFLNAMWSALDERAKTALLLACYLVSGHDVLRSAWRSVTKGRMLDENFLMAVASLAAMAIGEMTEGCAVMLFYQVGECCQGYAVGRSRRQVKALLSLKADEVYVLRGGEYTAADPSDVCVGEEIRIRPGERVPLDAQVLTGVSEMDTSALTGESVPRSAGAGDEVLAGFVALSGVITARVT